MFKLTSRIKLFLVLISFAVFAALMFTYGYGSLESRNQTRVDAVMKQNLELQVLKKEQLNFEQGNKDIATLSQKTYPPQDLFSKDTKVVKEVKFLEDLGKKYNLDFNLQVAGTSKTAAKVPGVNSELLLVPYTVSITGTFANIQKYIQAGEHTPFINQTQGINVQSGSEGKTRASLTSVFYLKP